MKGFPNQVTDLAKIAVAIQTLEQIESEGRNGRDDGIFGAELVRAGVVRPGRGHQTAEQYLREQARKEPSNQSFRTTARGLRELFRLLRLSIEVDGGVHVTELGRRAAAFAGSPLRAPQIAFWRTVIRNMTHTSAEGDTSHPYQVLLRLVAARPGITRAKCALALEAKNDSTPEIERIAVLADETEEEIRRQIGVSRANWDNAKKVLPSFAEQLGDVVRNGYAYVLAVGPGHAGEPSDDAAVAPARHDGATPRPPKSSRKVTPETIGRAGTVGNFDEAQTQPNSDPEAAREAVRQRLARLRRHNTIVRALATRLADEGATLYEDPFDVLALTRDAVVLAEVKSLDGSPADERERVQEALAQLLYYEAFVAAPIAGENRIRKIACFERAITTAHQEWLNAAGIGTLWVVDEKRFAADALGRGYLRDFLGELR